PRLFLAFRSPVFGSDEYYAASVAAAVLGMGKGSRLQRALVRERQVATEANAFTFDLSKGADLLVIDVVARPGTSGEQLERETAAEVDAFRRDGATDDDVRRAVALIETHFIAAMQQAGDRADRLSMFATYFGDPSLVNEQADRYRAVTAEQVTRFARERMGEDNRASLLYVPKEEGGERQAEDRDVEAAVNSVEVQG
ncbi:MAG TPA: insulinase family protein, partial [Gemmatimonadaceae bacterium]|nr:insulinase family protein [Gemmatimonadaceae bacterium]